MIEVDVERLHEGIDLDGEEDDSAHEDEQAPMARAVSKSTSNSS